MADIEEFHLLPEQVQKPSTGTWVLIVNPSTWVGYRIKIENFLKAQGYTGPLYDADGNHIANVVTGLIADVALGLEELETPDGLTLETPDGLTLETMVRNY